MLLSDYKFCSFDRENDVLYHLVTTENCGTKELFINSMSVFSTLIEHYQPKHLLIEIKKKPDFFELELKNFILKTLFKTMVQCGVKKIAAVVHDKKEMENLKVMEYNGFFAAKIFNDFDLAKKWLAE